MSALPVPLNVRASYQNVLSLPLSSFTLPESTLPVPNATLPFWIKHLDNDHQPSLTEGSTGELTADADVCIIGSGITGVSAAYHLAKTFADEQGSRTAPVKVVILEAREFCSGATGRNGGHLTPHAFAHFNERVERWGPEGAKRSLQIERYTSSAIRKILEDAGKVDDVDLVSHGRVILLFNEEEERAARADYESVKATGIDVSDVQWFTKEEAQERYGTPYPAVLTPGSNIWPLKAVSVLYNLAKSATSNMTLTLHTQTPVTHISPVTTQGRRWQLHTPRGNISCNTVLHATNGYSSHLLPFMRGFGPLGIVPTRGQVISTRAKSSSPFGDGKEGFVGNGGFEYWFPRPKHETEGDNELVILGGGREVAQDGKFEFFVVDDSALNKEVGDVVRKFLPAVFPGRFEKEQEPELEWTGIMGYTKSGEPFVGPVIDPSQQPDVYTGQYISAGYTGHGMPRAFACAEAVVGMIYAEMTGTTWASPEWLPKHYLTTNRASDAL